MKAKSDRQRYSSTHTQQLVWSDTENLTPPAIRTPEDQTHSKPTYQSLLQWLLFPLVVQLKYKRVTKNYQ